MARCCFCSRVRDAKPRPLDPHDVYQQFEIIPYNATCNGDGSYYAKSLAKDGNPPSFLRSKGWKIYSKPPKNYELHEAKGINDSLRPCLSDLNFPPSTKSSISVIVGKWYCPFVFIKEGRQGDHVENSMYCEMTLEQKWERVFEQKNEHNSVGDVHVNAAVHSEAVFLGESRVKVIWDERNVVDGAIWFKCLEDDYKREESIGLSLKIVERMRWEVEKYGWVGGGEKRIERVKRDEKFEGIGGWKRFGCYVLVERFVLKRMYGSLVLTYDFAHSHQLKSIFE